MADKLWEKHRFGKIFKRAMALFIIVIINFNSYAAVISSNDGSAFITKAEFDALVNDFNSRIEDYEKSIDAKIDGAIAEYLAGLATSRIDTLNIIFSDWTEGVYNLNGDLDPTFKLPSVDLFYSLGQDYKSSDNIVWKMWWAWCSMKYTSSFSGTQYRPLVRNVVENPYNISGAIWDGRAVRWTEFIMGTRGDEQYSSDPAIDLGYIGSDYPNIRLKSMCNFGSTGYYASANAVQWKPSVFWYDSHSESNYSSVVKNKAFQYSHEINMEEYNGITTDYNHIISYSDSTWSVWNVNWSKTINVANDNTKTRKDLFDAATKSGHISGCEFATYDDSATANQNSMITNGRKVYFSQRKNTSMAETSTRKLVTAGLVSDNMKSTAIKQTEKRIYNYAGKSYTLNLNLCQGLPICAASAGENIVWKPVFSDITCESSANSYITKNGKVNILLATQPFGARGTVSSSYIIKTKDMKEGKVTTNYTTTPENSLTTTLEFEMPTDGIVYAIWWPTCTNDTYRNDKKWQIKLDIANCSTYIREAVA